MSQRDDAELFARFSRRLAGIEPDVKAPPPWRPPVERRAQDPRTRGRFHMAWSATKVAATVAIIAMGAGFLVSNTPRQPQVGGQTAPAAESPSPAGSISPAASAVGTTAQSPMPSASAAVIHGWPGAHGDPPGLYSWTVGEPGWMHNRGGDEPDSERVEITFQALADDAYRIDPVTGLEMAGVDIDGPYSEVPELVVDTRMQAWVLDLDGTRVVVTIKSYADTAASQVAEAEAIVASIRVEPAGTGPAHRLVFEAPEGWGSD